MKIILTPRQIMSVWKAVQELSAIVLPYKEARRLVSMKKRLEEELETVTHMEKTLVQEFGGMIERNGNCKFPDNETLDAFLEKYDPAMEAPNEIRLPRLNLSKYTNSIRLSAAAVDALDGIVSFEEEAENG